MIFISTVLFVASTLLISALTFGILFALWFIVVPYLLVDYYLKQGGEGYFKPFLGFFQDRLLEARLEGDFLSYFKKMRSHQRFVVSNLGNKAVLFLTDTDLIKEFVNQPQDYCKARMGAGIEAFFESQGILFSEAEQWKRQRKLLTAAFNNEFLKEQTILMSAFVEKAYEDNGILKGSTNISQLFKKLSGDIIGYAFFGPVYQKYTFEEQPMTLGMQNLLADAFDQAYTMWNILLGHLFIRAGVLPQHRKLVNRIQDLRNSLFFIIQDIKRRNSLAYQPNCLLKNLLEQQKQTPENAMTDQEIVDNFISLFIAGAKTTGNLVSAVLYHLTQHPEINEKVRLEIMEKLGGESTGELNFEQTQKMEYLLAVIKESLRQNNPQGMLTYREAIQDHQIQDIIIKKGTLVTFSPLISCFDEKFFVRCFEFRPERWLLEKSENLALKKQPFGFIPFSAGPKACLGQHFALIQAKVMLIGFLKRFQMNLIEDDGILKMTHRETYEPLEDIKMILTPRL